MGKRVAICAVAQTRFEPNMWYRRFQDMAFEVVESVVKETGVTFDIHTGIRNIITCSDDVFDARTISDNAMTDAVGAHFRGEEKVAMDGINAIAYGMASVLSGHDDVVLVVGHSKESQCESRNMVTNLAFDPFYLRPLGLDYRNLSAMQAREYMALAGLGEEHLAKIVVRSRENAAKNPVANAREKVSAEDVMKSPMVCDPIRALHQYPVTDGAIAMIIASEERASQYTDKPVWLTGFGNCMDAYFPGERELCGNFALKKAAGLAYKMAGVKNPAKEFDLAEVNDCYAYQLPLWCEGVGLCPEKGGAAWIDGGGMEKGNINMSGGMLSGNPLMIGGMARAAEAALQLRGEAGERQVDGAKKALAHGTTGAAGQFQAVLILEKG